MFLETDASFLDNSCEIVVVIIWFLLVTQDPNFPFTLFVVLPISTHKRMSHIAAIKTYL